MKYFTPERWLKLQHVEDECVDQRVLGGEAAIEGPHADAGQLSDLLDPGAEPVLGEDLVSGGEQAAAVLRRVTPPRAGWALALPHSGWSPARVPAATRASSAWGSWSARRCGTSAPARRPRATGTRTAAIAAAAVVSVSIAKPWV